MAKGRNKTGRRKRGDQGQEGDGCDEGRRKTHRGPEKHGWLSEREYALLVRQWRAWKNMNMNITDMVYLTEGDDDD